ncbi:hypothetical protein F5141DRAFT_1147056 [Pisolithus sp. B1]|nr:hypothetical protein F5141DRAFT_1147056 [Pisolithus sp. B1]
MTSSDLTSPQRSPDLSRPSPSWHSRTTSALPSGSRQYQCSTSHIELLLRTDTNDSECHVNPPLTLPPLASRASRLPTLSPGPDPSPNTLPHSAISHPSYTYLSENVFRQEQLVNDSSASRPGPSSYSGQHPTSPLTPLESSPLSRSSIRHAAINQPSTRPRTSPNQVFNNISDLAAHYGIPQSLPRVPLSTPRRSEPESTVPIQNDFSSAPDFASLCSNYLTMLSQNPGDGDGATGVRKDTAPLAPPCEVMDTDAIQTIIQALNGTPELQASNDLNEYLTSPLLDSPMDDDLLTTPAVGSADLGADIYTSPLLGDFDGDSFGEFPPLFRDFDDAVHEQPKPHSNLPVSERDLDSMYKISPTTPYLDSPMPVPFDDNVYKPGPARRKTATTGTRKNIGPDDLVPVDAPTQSRKYLTPSSTSRKTVPAVWARKRSRQAAFGNEEDQLPEDVGPSLSEQEAIEAKRRQNTIAARRSRKRKLEYQKELEDSAERYKRESEIWKMRAQTYCALLHSHGISVPDLGPDP